MTMRTMFDSTTAADIPQAAGMVAGYVDGRYRWSAADWARFPNAVKVRIACFAPTNDGQVLDVETGDALPWEAPDWAARRRAAGVDPVIYVNRSNWAPTRTEFQLRRMVEPWWWLSTLDNSRPWAPRVVAIQYAGSALAGGHYDLSDVSDQWPGLSSAGGETMDPELRDFLNQMLQGNGQLRQWLFQAAAGVAEIKTELAAIKTELDALKAGGAAGAAHYDLTITPKP
jgi:hypothetical protein